jgi:tetratricopeptide (TPR) repeat protein
MRSVSLLSLLCLCSGASARNAAEFSALEFFPPQPVTAVQTVGTGVRSVAVHDDGPDATPAREPGAASEEPLDAIEQRLEAIRIVEARDGARSKELAEELLSLAALYREAGDHLLAIGTLERALDVVRINDGLHSLEQVPVIERLIENRVALGDYSGAAALDQSVLELVSRDPGDARVASILVAVADRQMEAVERFVEHGHRPQVGITSGSSIGPAWDPRPALTGRRAALASLRGARGLYNAAIVIARRTGYDVAELFAIEDKLIRSLYAEVTHPDLYSSRIKSVGELPVYAPGEAILRAHIVNSASHRRTALAVARALLKLGDWQLLFSKNGTALETYQTAHDLLVREKVSPETIGELLTPAVPVALPLIEPSPDRGGDDALAHRGYVDVSFVVSRYGRAKSVEALAASSDTPEEVVERARQHVWRSRFRPRFADGVPARDDRVAVRYYYDY